jgi:centromere protein C
MAPRAKRSSPKAFYEFGKQGRATGVSLPEGGPLDEHGMQPIDDIFSSPQKTPGRGDDGGNDDDDSSGSEEMDIESSP